MLVCCFCEVGDEGVVFYMVVDDVVVSGCGCCCHGCFCKDVIAELLSSLLLARAEGERVLYCCTNKKATDTVIKATNYSLIEYIRCP